MDTDLDIFVTFDIDYSSAERNEAVTATDFLLPLLLENQVKATWFIRLDKKVGLDFGSPDFLFRDYGGIISSALEAGHTIAWHPHPYCQANGKWQQDTNDDSIVNELSCLVPYTRQCNLRVARMGWGFQTNKVMRFLNDNGFVVDSSAIPRPNYAWEETKRDWTITGNRFYYPSVTDYRTTDPNPANNLAILEVPITTMRIKSRDDQRGVLRYFNLAYRTKALERPLDQYISQANHLVTITHPYELDSRNGTHHLISFNAADFSNNILLLRSLARKHNKSISWKTLSEASGG